MFVLPLTHCLPQNISSFSLNAIFNSRKLDYGSIIHHVIKRIYTLTLNKSFRKPANLKITVHSKLYNR